MQYFSLLPNVFVGEGITDDEPYRYRLVKNLFRRTKVRQDLDQYITLLETRIIPDGMRPEEVSLQALGSPYLDWILLMVNEITDVYEQWPRSEERLLSYVQNKYDLQTIGFYLVAKYRELQWQLKVPFSKEMLARKMFTKDKFIADYNTAYDVYFYVKSDTKVSNQVFESKDNTTNKRMLKKAFMSGMKKRINSRVLLQNFIKRIA